jgi:DUF971 family protein
MLPETIRNHLDAGLLEIIWSDGTRQGLTHTLLRRECQCADCKSQRQHTGDKLVVSETVRVTDIRPVGNYGIQLVFTDRHERGIYPWIYLQRLGDDPARGLD